MLRCAKWVVFLTNGSIFWGFSKPGPQQWQRLRQEKQELQRLLAHKAQLEARLGQETEQLRLQLDHQKAEKDQLQARLDHARDMWNTCGTGWCWDAIRLIQVALVDEWKLNSNLVLTSSIGYVTRQKIKPKTPSQNSHSFFRFQLEKSQKCFEKIPPSGHHVFWLHNQQDMILKKG